MQQLGQRGTENKASQLLCLQAKIDTLQKQFVALLSYHAELKANIKNNPTLSSNCPSGEPKPEENEEHAI